MGQLSLGPHCRSASAAAKQQGVVHASLSGLWMFILEAVQEPVHCAGLDAPAEGGGGDMQDPLSLEGGGPAETRWRPGRIGPHRQRLTALPTQRWQFWSAACAGLAALEIA